MNHCHLLVDVFVLGLWIVLEMKVVEEHVEFEFEFEVEVEVVKLLEEESVDIQELVLEEVLDIQGLGQELDIQGEASLLELDQDNRTSSEALSQSVLVASSLALNDNETHNFVRMSYFTTFNKILILCFIEHCFKDQGKPDQNIKITTYFSVHWFHAP
jgi:hypothetical protein